ncbi:RHS repeat-associated protein [Dysgonomonas sp. PFB1-18]|uniref:RHS repeat-associated core domain-containing protein n=1 Tax=unclassified Dysgonomonas TaxID=2630389 RepID=UPI002476E3A0|nr:MULTISPECIES: RHS repeat-associated core domain-containing protein [unclassified Dysgonomonas]MDH6310470.1 RHS repeat-associated protein [Dysgonomonas sp. PF1-14]MDH6340908.1 RHS repeat-associated protein [Dysgonomonas sp. PF1-16]MDH6382677.1 RHS repeat-associated protein [Dysgonomonas sp. PFB1-18]MDH6399897.1 RHS repeat-associated protein [Dysgonomonas sp. PF1-23]
MKLKVKHTCNPNFSTAPVIASDVTLSLLTQVKETDYVGNKIYENGKLKRILVDGGYWEDGKYHFFRQDHLGNTRTVQDQDGTFIQRKYYYPFGAGFPENCKENAKQPYKYNGKELDQMHRLDWYDYSARHYEPSIGRFTTVDPLAEKYYSWSPYNYVGNNPIKRVDPNGKDWVVRIVDGITEYYYDRDIRSQEDANSKYGSNNFVMHLSSGSSMTRYNANGEMTAQFTFFNDGSNSNEYGAVIDVHGNLMPDDKIIYGNDFTIFGTSDNSVNAETLHKNLFPSALSLIFGPPTSYTGSNNPLAYNGELSYQYKSRNRSELGSMVHDIIYTLNGAGGENDAFFNTSVRDADLFLVNYNIINALRPSTSRVDRNRSLGTAILFNYLISNSR